MIRPILIAAAIACAAWMGACESGGRSNSAVPSLAEDSEAAASAPGGGPEIITPASTAADDPAPQIDAIQLMSMHSAINLDDRPGADGIQLSVFLFRQDQPLALRLERGTLELVLYDGRVAATQLASAQPARIWRYSAANLRSIENRSAIGVGYRTTLDWSDARPQSSVVTLAARILRPGKPALYAKPAHIPVGPR